MVEYLLDKDPLRFVLIVTIPFIFCASLVRLLSYDFVLPLTLGSQFFSMSVLGIFTQAIGPVAQYHQNSTYYSAVKPAANPAVDNNLPHITIQMPVFRESLRETMYVVLHHPPTLI
jgi:hypothetical protein